MTGGEISGNTASSTLESNGGGVFVRVLGATFRKTDGIIYGYTEENIKSNVVKDISGVLQNNKGHAVYVSSVIHKETTADANENLSFNSGSNSGYWD